MNTLKAFFYLGLLLSFFSCANTNQKEVSIDGDIEGIEDGTVVRLRETKDRMFVTLDTDTIYGGKFNFTYFDSIPEVKSLALFVNGEGFPPMWLDLWIEPGAKVKITGKDKLLKTWNVKSNVAEQIEYNKYVDKSRQAIIENQITMFDITNYFNLINSSNDDAEKKLYRQKIDSLNEVSRGLEVDIMKNELELLSKSSKHDKVWFNIFLEHAMQLFYLGKENYPDADQLKSLYNELTDSEKGTEIGQKITAFLFPPIVVKDGDKMADADLIDLQGNIKRLADYTDKYRLLDFWSTGCGYCIRAMPELMEVSEMYKDKLVVVGINSDSREVWSEFSNENKIAGVNLNDPKGDTGLQLNYGVKGVPHYVLLDADDKVVASWWGYRKGSLLKKTEELLK